MLTPNQKELIRFTAIWALAMAVMFAGCFWLAWAMPIEPDAYGFLPGEECYNQPTDGCLEGSGGYVPAEIPLSPLDKMGQV